MTLRGTIMPLGRPEKIESFQIGSDLLGPIDRLIIGKKGKGELEFTVGEEQHQITKGDWMIQITGKRSNEGGTLKMVGDDQEFGFKPGERLHLRAKGVITNDLGRVGREGDFELDLTAE